MSKLVLLICTLCSLMFSQSFEFNPITRKLDLVSASGSGEANTMSNLGSGVGLYQSKSGVNFNLKSLAAGSSKVTVTANASGNTVDIDVAESALALSAIGGTLPLNKISTSAGDAGKALKSNGSVAAFGDIDWAELTGKPSTFAPAAHTASHKHGGSDEVAVFTPAANGIPKAGSDGYLSLDWLRFQMSLTYDASGIKLVGDASTPGVNKYYGTNGSGVKGYYDIPTASTHSHAISDVTGLQTALDGKSPLFHTHVIGDTTNLQSTLDAKAPLASPTFTGTATFATAVVGASQTLSWTGRSVISSPADGAFTVTNNAGNDFTALNLGGVTSSFPRIARSSAMVEFKLADNSGYTGAVANEAYIGGSATTDGTWKFALSSGNLIIQKRESGSYVTKATFIP